jgi:putative phosphoesterase
MKIAILGDIHGNKDALNAVLKDASKVGVELLMITGDLVGYYPFAKEVLELLANWKTKIVRGNHEDMLKESINNKTYLNKISKKYGSGLKESLNNLSNSYIEYLVNLPHPIKFTIDNNRFILAHGAPDNINKYIYPDSDLTKLPLLEDIDCDILICGHTHYPMQRSYGKKTIINPGSVGQPRNKGSGANWVLYDSTNKSFNFRVSDYDISHVVRWAKNNNPEMNYLHEVFTR